MNYHRKQRALFQLAGLLSTQLCFWWVTVSAHTHKERERVREREAALIPSLISHSFIPAASVNHSRPTEASANHQPYEHQVQKAGAQISLPI